MKVYEALEKAKALLERGWVRNIAAVDARGIGVSPGSPEATRYCAQGALMAAGGHGDVGLYMQANRILGEAMGDWRAPEGYTGPGNVYGNGSDRGYRNVASFNNVEGQKATVELFQKAIRLAKEQEGIRIEIPVPKIEETDRIPVRV